MKEDRQSDWRRAQSAETSNEGANTGSPPLYVAPTPSIDEPIDQDSAVYDNVPRVSYIHVPATFASDHVTSASSRGKNIGHGGPCCGCVAPVLLMALLLICVTLQSLLIFHQLTGNPRDDVRDDETTQNISCVTESDQRPRGRSPRCPDLCIAINDKCYFFSEIQKQRQDADKDCAERGSSLAIVKDETARRLVNVTGKEFWVGLTKYNIQGDVWAGRWTDGSTETITEGTGTCVKLGSRLSRENCYMALHWICERAAE